jgi:hypothetical protein
LNSDNVGQLERTEVVVLAADGLGAAGRARASSNDGDRAADQSSLSGEALRFDADKGENLSESRGVGGDNRVAYGIANINIIKTLNSKKAKVRKYEQHCTFPVLQEFVTSPAATKTAMVATANTASLENILSGTEGD